MEALSNIETSSRLHLHSNHQIKERSVFNKKETLFDDEKNVRMEKFTSIKSSLSQSQKPSSIPFHLDYENNSHLHLNLDDNLLLNSDSNDSSHLQSDLDDNLLLNSDSNDSSHLQSDLDDNLLLNSDSVDSQHYHSDIYDNLLLNSDSDDSQHYQPDSNDSSQLQPYVDNDNPQLQSDPEEIPQLLSFPDEYLPEVELNVNNNTQTKIDSEKNELNKILSAIEPSLPDFIICNKETDNSERQSVIPEPMSEITSNIPSGEDEESTKCVQIDHIPGDETIQDVKQQVQTTIKVCNVTENVQINQVNLLQTSERLLHSTSGFVESPPESRLPSQNLATRDSNSALFFMQDQNLLSDDSSVTKKRHIKSFLNIFMNKQLNTEEHFNDDITDITDGFASVFKSSRKRSHNRTYKCTDGSIHQPSSDVSELAMDTRDSGFKRILNSEDNALKMDVPSKKCRYERPCSPVENSLQENVTGIRLCTICDTSTSHSVSVLCRNSHVVCQSCWEDEVRQVMASQKMFVSCPKESCKVPIPLDSLSKILPKFIVDLLNDNLRLKEQKASAKAIKKMQGLVVCPHCSCPGLLEEQMLHFLCATCHSNSCRYCKTQWTGRQTHDSCYLLSFVGTECLKDISKLPQNWDKNVTQFNKNFVQINIPLTSNIGSAVAAFFAKTSSGNTRIVQLFQIQNVKLWEKYILKRKHVEEEIGCADLKEKLLFHGTKAENIVNICGEGFDIRVPTSNGALLGKGIYFSVNAKYSEKYADNSGRIFLSRVICGWSQTGQRQFTRPQYHQTSRRMYDSCVDNLFAPSMYTIFDNSQCYPEYLIEFARK